MAALTFYKATRPDATSFYDGETKWRVGRIVRHPAPDLSLGICSAGVLHISDAPGETLVGGSWPCRLFEVEPRDEMIGPEDHKYGCTVVEVVRELPAWQALGPNGEAVVALIERCRTLTLDAAWYAVWYVAWDAARDAAWYAARGAAWYAARDAARDAARYAAWYAAWGAAWYAVWYATRDAARYAALALIVKDLITPEQFEILYGPWASVMGS
jgi:hypothetical protein